MGCRKSKVVSMFPLSAWVVGFWLTASCAGYADGPGSIDRADGRGGDKVSAGASVVVRVHSIGGDDLVERVSGRVRRLEGWLLAWYYRTPPPERATWGGLAACAGMGLVVLMERMVRLRRRRVMPSEFTARFLDRLHEGRLDCGQALDHCELNPSPAARVALAAVRRWGRPASDLERTVTLAHRVETEQLRRNVGTLRRVAALAPLLGVLGTLFAVGRALEAIPPAPAAAAGAGGGPSLVAPPPPGTAPVAVAWGPALAAALTPLSTGIIIATLALVAYDGVLTRVELAGALDRLGAETIEAIAQSAPIAPTPIMLGPAAFRGFPSPRVGEGAQRADGAPSSPSTPTLPHEAGGRSPSQPARTPHQAMVRRDEGLVAGRHPSAPEIGF